MYACLRNNIGSLMKFTYVLHKLRLQSTVFESSEEQNYVIVHTFNFISAIFEEAHKLNYMYTRFVKIYLRRSRENYSDVALRINLYMNVVIKHTWSLINTTRRKFRESPPLNL